MQSTIKDKLLPDLVLVLTTVDSAHAAEELAQKVLQQQLAACISVIANITSHYNWNGKREKSTEQQLLIKTSQDNSLALIRLLEEIHPYQCPEIIVLDQVKASLQYSTWVKDCCKH
ncbi:divalent-cation tolerance protein CutA [bacterium]|nr:divalent-cation tolerance protein CutA [bacterium]